MRRFYGQGLLCVAFLAVGACATTKPNTSIPMGVSDFDGNARLSQGVTPTAYDLDLYIVPDVDGKQGRVGGEVTISLKVSEPTQTLKLHGEEMKIQRAVLKGKGGEFVAKPLVGKNGGLVLELGRRLDVGAYTLHMTYEASVGEEPRGLYRVKEADTWYAYTQFQPLSARRAFPCFDEPGFKTPYTVALSVRPEHLALTNGPEVSRKDVQDAPYGATRRHVFATTKPLPTYLVAFAVGGFDVVKATTPSPVPIRAVTVRGKGHLARFLLEKTASMLAYLTEYFGQEYPFAKLDLVAVPNFRAGAMENVGLVTYRETLMLLDPKRATPGTMRRALTVTAHELAHMWFGNLVTPAWWDELWLNESFATWMATKVMEDLEPSYESGIRQVRGVSWLAGVDSLEKTRAIRQPIHHGGDVRNAFDGITYTKGAAVLRMVEGWLGADVFRQGVRSFMKENAHGVVTTKALMEALSRASGRPVFDVMKGFLDQPGMPLLHVKVVCQESSASLSLTQERYVPVASKAERGLSWKVPVCVSYGDGGKIRRQCDVLASSQGTMVLKDAVSCPTWVNPNAGAGGYYLWTMDEAAFAANAERMRGSMTLREQVALFGQTSAMVKAKKMKPEALVALAQSLVRETNHHLVSRALGVFEGMRMISRGEKLEPELGALLSRLFRPHLDRLGLSPREGESPGDAALRQRLLRTLGTLAEDDYVIANAKGVLAQFLKAPEQVPAWHTSWALPIAVRGGDALLWEQLVQIVGKTSNPGVRRSAVYALGMFDDPKLQEKTRALFLTDALRSSEMWSVVGPLMRSPEVFEGTWGWFTAHFDAVVKKLGASAVPGLVFVGQGFCDREGASKVEAFFKEKVSKNPGLGRNLSTTMESIERCRVQRELMRASVVRVLKAEKVK